jgi:hypothetical protein
MSFTQNDDEDLFAESQETNDNATLTQVPTLEGIMEAYEADPSTVTETGIVCEETLHDGTVERKPLYFFMNDKVVTIGAGHYPDKPMPDLCLSGKGYIGMSHVSLRIAYTSNPETIHVEVLNNKGILVTRSDGTIERLDTNEKGLLFRGDQIIYSRINGCERLNLIVHRGPLRESTASTSQNNHAAVENPVAENVLAMRKRRLNLEIRQCIDRLELASENIENYSSLDDLDMQTESQLQTAVAGIVNVFPNILADIGGDYYQEPNKTAQQPKRKRASSQEHRRGASEHKKARKAQEVLARQPLDPRNPGRKSKRFRDASNTLSKASKTVCRFWKSGYCKLGNDCSYLHPDSTPPGQEEAKSGLKGRITDWKTRSLCDFGFIEARGTTYFVSVNELPSDMHPTHDQLPIDVVFDVMPRKELGKHAEAVNVQWS